MSTVYLAVLAGLAAAGTRGLFARARRRRAWPLARGTVVSCEVLELDRHFMAVVRYTYALAPSTAYRGTTHHLSGKLESSPSRDVRKAEALLLHYPVGERIDIHYDPDRPSRSVAAARS
jgi:hypothetical protein